MKGLVVLILAFASFSFRAPTAYGSFLSFQNLVVFGDSLSDNGNTFISVGLPKAPYYDGRWTNGPNWVDYFSQLAGIPDASAFLRNRGTNFAVGGSTSLLAGEIATYLAENGGRADSFTKTPPPSRHHQSPACRFGRLIATIQVAYSSVGRNLNPEVLSLVQQLAVNVTKAAPVAE